MLRDAFRHAGAFIAGLGATCFLLIASCSGTGGFRVVPEPLRPEIGRYFTRTNIRGHCFLTDGTYCLPCNGGPPMNCAELLLLDVGPLYYVEPMEPNTGPPPPRLDPPPMAPETFALLTGGLDGPDWAKAAGLLEWVHGESVELPFRATLDEDADMLDISFLWWSDWDRPTPGELPPGVQADFYAAGDFTDVEPDMMLIRLFGPTADVNKAMSFTGDPVITWIEPDDGG